MSPSDTPRSQALQAEYIGRINRVLDHIDAHLDSEMSLAELSRVACFSPYHFHRIFRSMVREPLGAYIKRRRLHKAASLLRSDRRRPVTEVALDCGFSSSAAFARAFKDAFGVSATQWRRSASGGAREEVDAARIDPGSEGSPRADRTRDGADDPGADSKIGQADGKPGQVDGNLEKEHWPGFHYLDPVALQPKRRFFMDQGKIKVELQDLPERTVAYVRHIGPYKGDSALFEGLFQKLFGWAAPRGLVRFPQTEILVIYHDDPEITEEEKQRISACLTVPPGTSVDGEVGTLEIPAGKYAKAFFELLPDEYGQAWQSIMAGWLPQSGFQCDDRPCYERYLNDPKEHPEGKHLVEIHVPVKPL